MNRGEKEGERGRCSKEEKYERRGGEPEGEDACTYASIRTSLYTYTQREREPERDHTHQHLLVDKERRERHDQTYD